MTMAVGLTVSEIGRGQMSEESGHREIHYSSQNMKFRTTYCIFSETLGLNKRLDLGDDPDQDQEFSRNFSKFQNRSFSAICALRTHL